MRTYLPPLHWTIDERPVDVAGWRMNAVVNGGYDRMTGNITEAAFRRLINHVDQEAVIVAYDPAGVPRWYGRLVKPPRPTDGMVALSARGPMERAESATDLLLYQTRDYSLFTPGDSDPYHFSRVPPELQCLIAAGSITFQLPAGTTVQTSDRHRAAAWFPGNIPTRVALHADANVSMGNWDVEFQTAVGPSGTLTQRYTTSLALTPGTGLDIDSGVFDAGDDDIVTVTLRHTAAPASYATDRVPVFTQIRVNGIASGDEMFNTKVMADIGQRLGWDSRGVAAGGTNALPYYLSSGSWLDGLTYLGGLTDYRWLALEERERLKGPWLDVGPWTGTWHVLRSHSAQPALDTLPLYNQVRVRYTTTAGSPASVVVVADPDPLARYGITRTWEIVLNDPQEDAQLASDVADAVLPRVSTQRYTGRIPIVGAFDDTGVGHPYAVLPGSFVDLADHDLAEAVQLPVHEVEYTETEVTLGIEAPVTADGLIHLNQLALARSL